MFRQVGLQPGDVVIQFDGRKFEESFQLMRQIRRVRAGEMKDLDVVRKERRLTIHVTFQPRPKNP